MPPDQNTTLTNKILAFTKYARFISEKFDVTVEFDGVKAHTGGRVITLPNLIGMSDRDLDFLYCILLHEVGHIRYTDFAVKELSQFKTESHFNLFNSIEDARIENLLMRDFDGAHDIFSKLYNEFLMDEKYMIKLFGHDLKASSLFTSVTRYLHHELIGLNSKVDLKTTLTPKAYKPLMKFISDYGVDEILNNSKIVTQQDAAKLATDIYNLCLKKSADRSDKNNVNELSQATKDAVKSVSRAIAKIEENANELKTRQEEINQVDQETSEIRNKIRPDLSKIEEEIKNFNQQVSECESLHELNEEVAAKENYLKRVQDRRDKKEQSILDATKKRDAIKSLCDDPNKTNEKLQANLKKLEERTKEFSDQLKTYDKRLQDLNENLKSSQSKQAEKNSDLRNLSQEELKEKVSELESAVQAKQTDAEELNGEVTEKVNEAMKLRSDLEERKKDHIRDASEALNSIQSGLLDAGINAEIIPGFQPTPGWGESDEVQREFDSEASAESGEVVVNGSALSQSGMRDIMLILEQAGEKVESIDVAEIFKEQNRTNRLDSFNDMSKITQTNEDQNGEKAKESERKHLALTLEFDQTKTKTTSSGLELGKLRIKNKTVIDSLKNIFRFKLKFQKKNKFMGGREEGGLDTRSLWKLATGTDSNFYEQINPKFVNDISASIAVDISGSMDKASSDHGEKLRELALMLSDALQSTYIKHEVLGYHAPVSPEMRQIESSPVYNRKSNRLETIVYKNFSDAKSNGLENIGVECTDNSDGESLRLAGLRLLRERGKRKILFVVTDGKPFLSNSDVSVLDQDLKATLSWLKSRGVEVYAFGFNEEPRAFYGQKYCLVKSYSELIQFFNNSL